jgi:hypothetical protein
MYQLDDIDMNFFQTARFCFVAHVELNCTPAQLFDIFEDALAWTVWATPIQSVEWTSPRPFGIGTTRTVTMAGTMQALEEFIAWERGARMAFKFTHSNKNSISAFGEDYVVTDLGNGRCQLDWTMAMQPKGASKVILIIIKPIMGRMVQYLANNLAKYVARQTALNIPGDATDSR